MEVRTPFEARRSYLVRAFADYALAIEINMLLILGAFFFIRSFAIMLDDMRRWVDPVSALVGVLAVLMVMVFFRKKRWYG